MRTTTLRFAWLILFGLLSPFSGRWSLLSSYAAAGEAPHPAPLPSLAAGPSAAVLQPGRFFFQGEEPLGCVAVMQYGQVVQCSVAAVGEVNVISFSGVSGERVRVRASETSGSLYARLEIRRPGGSVLCGPVTTDELTCLLDATGTFELRVSDSSNSRTGTYGLSLQRLNNPAGCTALSFGAASLSRSLSYAAEYDCYTFSGINGDRVRARLRETSGSLYLRQELVRADGTTLCSPATSDEVDCILDGDGSYTLLVSDQNGTNTGSYSLAFQRLNDPAGCTALSFGAPPLNRSLSYAAEYDCYTFNGANGDRVRARSKETSGSLYLRQELVRADGTVLCSQSTNEELDCILDADGAYTLLVSDQNGTNTGSYSLAFQRLNDPVGCTALSFGAAPLSRSLSYAAEYDCYTFNGANGDRVRARLKETSGSLYLRQELVRADGTVLCSQTTNEELDCILDTDGAYTLLVTDHTGTNTGSYSLVLLRLNSPVGCTALSFGGAPLNRSLSYAAEYDCYTFNGANGDRVRSRLKEAASSLYLRQELLRSDGTVLCSQTTSEEVDCILDGDGAYTLLVTDHTGTNTGSYSLAHLRLNNPAGCTRLSFGANPLGGSIGYAAEYDCYTFSGVDGDRVRSRLKEAASSLYLRHELLRADGTVLCSQTTSEELNCTLDASGEYTLLVTDQTGSNTGSYHISLLRLNAPLGCRSITYGVSLVRGSIDLAAQTHCYKFTGSQADQLRIWVDETSGNLYMSQELLHPDGSTVCGPTTAQDISCTLDVAGVYALLVSDQSGTGKGGYEINVLCEAGVCYNAPPPLPPGSTRLFLPQVMMSYAFSFPGPWEREENDSFSLANGPLVVERDYYGYPNDDRDFFYLHLARAGRLDVALSNHVGTDVQFHIYNQASGQRVCYDPDPPFQCSISVQRGTYYIFIYTAAGFSSTKPYTLQASFLTSEVSETFDRRQEVARLPWAAGLVLVGWIMSPYLRKKPSS